MKKRVVYFLIIIFTIMFSLWSREDYKDVEAGPVQVTQYHSSCNNV